MSSFKNTSLGAAAIVFIILYTAYVGFSAYIVCHKGFKLIYTLLCFYGIIRWGGQLCGIVLAVVGDKFWRWKIAYVVLSNQGFIFLILASFNYITKAERKYFGVSRLDPRSAHERELYLPRGGRLLFSIFHLLLIVGTVLIIYGSTSLASTLLDDHATITRARIIRTVGLSIILALDLLTFYFAWNMYRTKGVRHQPELNILAFVAPFLIIRGVYSILTIYVAPLKVLEFSLTATLLVIGEYVMGVLMEFISAVLLISVYYASPQGLTEELSHESHDMNHVKHYA